VSVPHSKNFSPCWVGDTVVINSSLEMSVWNSVVILDEESSFPDQDDCHEESHQADGVKDSHVSLSLILITNQNDEEDHHESNEGGRSCHDS